MPSPRVLLTSVLRPIGPEYGDAPSVSYDAVSGQFTKQQGILSPRAYEPHYGIEYAAANVDAPAVTLQYPNEAEFVRELRLGDYSHVGITFNACTAHYMRHMSRLIRRHAPRAVVVLGGFGAALPDEELAKHADVWSRGEGAATMRRLLGEPARDPPRYHPLVVSTTRLFGLPMSRSGMIFGGLGCPRGCDFCCTSHQFARKYVPLLPEARHLMRVVQGYRAIDSDIQFRVLDEDFLSNRPRAMAFRELVQARGLHLSMFVFASVRSLSMYTPEELTEIGIGGVFIGFEGSGATYDKRKGRPMADLFADLKRQGIWIQTSMMLGQDYQTADAVRSELADLMALEPSAPLYSIYAPLPGTPLHDRVEADNRWLPQYRDNLELRWRQMDAFSVLAQHPHMAPEEIIGLQDWCYREDFQRLGPSLLRIAQVWHTGWLHLRDRPEPALRRRAAHLRRSLDRVGAILPLLWTMAPSAEVRRRVEALSRDLPPLTSRRQRIARAATAAAIHPIAAAYAASVRLGVGRHPRLRRSVWTHGPERAPAVRIED